MQRLVWWIAPVYSAAASTWLLLVPTYATASSTATLVEGQARPNLAEMQVATSMLEVDGWWVLIPLAVPIVLAAIPLAGRTPAARWRLGIVAGVLLLGFSGLAGFSIGYFYLPAALPLLVAALVTARRVGTSPSRR